jgi:hypothetical protein
MRMLKGTDSCAKKTHVNKLDTVQNTALRLALGALHATSARDLEVEAGILSLSSRRQSKTLKYYTRVDNGSGR